MCGGWSWSGHELLSFQWKQTAFQVPRLPPVSGHPPSRSDDLAVPFVRGVLVAQRRRVRTVAQPVMADVSPCYAMIYDRNLQATHCPEPSWTGRWFSPRGDRWWRVRACPQQLE